MGLWGAIIGTIAENWGKALLLQLLLKSSNFLQLRAVSVQHHVFFFGGGGGRNHFLRPNACHSELGIAFVAAGERHCAEVVEINYNQIFLIRYRIRSIIANKAA